MRGYNGTIMAYGQTGAGKTYTLSSIQPDAIGMIPRAAAEVFASIAGDPANEYSVFMSYIQIYMELIQVIDSSHAQGYGTGIACSGMEVQRLHELWSDLLAA